VLGRLVAGRTNKEIAHEPDISEKTVKSHLSKAFTKLHVTRRTRTAVLFLADGWASNRCSEVFRIAGDLHHP
jgi:DNA-binding NarL/FixJ family response regulator